MHCRHNFQSESIFDALYNTQSQQSVNGIILFQIICETKQLEKPAGCRRYVLRRVSSQ